MIDLYYYEGENIDGVYAEDVNGKCLCVIDGCTHKEAFETDYSGIISCSSLIEIAHQINKDESDIFDYDEIGDKVEFNEYITEI